MEAIAKWDFVGTSPNLLSFNKGAVLKLLSLKQEEPHWYLAELDQNVGLVSENMIEVEPSDWFYGNVKKSKIEKLFKKNLNLKFVIRSSLDNQLFLSYCHRLGSPNERVWHFKITKQNQSYTFFDYEKTPRRFFSLNQLAKFVTLNPWSAIFWIPYKGEEEGDKKNVNKIQYLPNKL